MPLRVEHHTSIPPTKVRDWFFDLREDDHTGGDHPRILRSKPGDYRKIISRTTERVEAEDAYQGGRVKVRFVLTKKGEGGIDYRVSGDWYDSLGALVAKPTPTGGSHVVFESDKTWKGFGRVMKLFMAPMLDKAIVEDQKAHFTDMEDDWKRQTW